jgi:hypothetical protein
MKSRAAKERARVLANADGWRETNDIPREYSTRRRLNFLTIAAIRRRIRLGRRRCSMPIALVMIILRTDDVPSSFDQVSDDEDYILRTAKQWASATEPVGEDDRPVAPGTRHRRVAALQQLCNALALDGGTRLPPGEARMVRAVRTLPPLRRMAVRSQVQSLLIELEARTAA